MLRLIFHMSDVQIARTFFACIITDCPGASCWDDWSHNRPWPCPQNSPFQWIWTSKMPGYFSCCFVGTLPFAQHWSSRVFFVHLRQVWAQCRKMKVLASTDNFFGSWPGHLKGRHIGEGLKWQRKDPGTNEGRAWYVYKFLLQPLALTL